MTAPLSDNRRSFEGRIVLPVFNEEKLLAKALPAFAAEAASRPELEFLFVDDGSWDRTAGILGDFAREHELSNVRVLALGSNAGKGGAVRAGILDPSPDSLRFMLFTDGDFAYPFSLIETFREKLDRFPVAIGSRSLPQGDARRTSLRRKALGAGFNLLTRPLFGFSIADTQAGIKGFQAAAAKEIFSRMRIMRFAFDVELLVISRQLGFDIAQIPVCVSGTHSYKTGKIKLLRDTILMFLELLAIQRNLAHGKYRHPRKFKTPLPPRSHV